MNITLKGTKCICLVLLLAGCAQAGRDSFVSQMDSAVGKVQYSTEADLLTDYRNSKSSSNIYMYKKNNKIHIERDYFNDGCRIGEVYDSNLTKERWYFISEPEKCELHFNWRGPW